LNNYLGAFYDTIQPEIDQRHLQRIRTQADAATIPYVDAGGTPKAAEIWKAARKESLYEFDYHPNALVYQSIWDEALETVKSTAAANAARYAAQEQARQERERVWAEERRERARYEIEHAAELEAERRTKEEARLKAEAEYEEYVRSGKALEDALQEAEKFRTPAGEPPSEAEVAAEEYWKAVIKFQYINEYGPRKNAIEDAELLLRKKQTNAVNIMALEFQPLMSQQWESAMLYKRKDLLPQIAAAEDALGKRLEEAAERKRNPEKWKAEREARHAEIRARADLEVNRRAEQEIEAILARLEKQNELLAKLAGGGKDRK